MHSYMGNALSSLNKPSYQLFLSFVLSCDDELMVDNVTIYTLVGV